MKVLMINGSPRKNGNTFTALSEIAKILDENQFQTEILHIGTKPIQGCTACGYCKEHETCVFKDPLYLETLEKIKTCDALIIGSPVYFAGPNGSLCALLDRIFYSVSRYLAYKPGACVAICRRGGASTTFDRLNKYFTISNMPLIPSQYWNSVHGRLPGEAIQDAEGLQTMRTLARNLIWMLNSIHQGQIQKPENEPRIATHFIR